MYSVLTIGTATRDVFVTSDAFQVLKDPAHLKSIGFPTGEAQCVALGSKVPVDRLEYAVGGGAANAAVTFSRLGFRTSALFRVGDDGPGDMVVAGLKREKVRPIVVRDPKETTGYGIILRGGGGGERTILSYRGAANGLKEKEISFSKLRAHAVYIVPGSISFGVIERLVMTLAKQGTFLAMNPSQHYADMGINKLKPILRKLQVVVMNREEASALTGVPYDDERGIFRKFDEVVPGIAVMTEGPSGALVSDGQFLYRSGVFKEKELVDRTGAGDAFGSGFVAGLLEKNDVHYALRIASANATSVVEHVGAHAGALTKDSFGRGKRWKYLDLDVEPL